MCSQALFSLAWGNMSVIFISIVLFLFLKTYDILPQQFNCHPDCLCIHLRWLGSRWIIYIEFGPSKPSEGFKMLSFNFYRICDYTPANYMFIHFMKQVFLLIHVYYEPNIDIVTFIQPTSIGIYYGPCINLSTILLMYFTAYT